MNKRMTLTACLGLGAALLGPAAFARQGAASVTIVASVGHSEWCPTGTVRLDLGSGRYTVTAPRTWRTCRRPPWPGQARAGALVGADLTTVRVAWQRAEGDGLDNPACRNGGRPDTIYVSNGGDRTLRLTHRGRTVSPPADESCWSDAANRLHDLLERLFNPRSAGLPQR